MIRQYKFYLIIRDFIYKYAQYVTAVSLFFGFIIDNIILQRIDSLFTFYIILYHFSVITLGILLIHALENKKNKNRYLKWIHLALEVIIPFSFGALFSGFFIFYSQSAGSIISWIFLIILMLFMISTEYYKKHYLNILVQITLWYFTLITFLNLYLPIILARINTYVFLLGGVLSLLGAWGYLSVLKHIEPGVYNKYSKKLICNIIVVFGLVNILYFTNIIPPIPLSVQNAGAYYLVVHKGDKYSLYTEQLPWFSIKKYIPTTIYLKPGNAVYIFSSVFAPTKLSTKIYHQWQYKDNNGRWQTASTIEFPIVGGRASGYRGYTMKKNVWDGAWRVRIITEREQVIGTTYFTIKITNVQPKLINVIY